MAISLAEAYGGTEPEQLQTPADKADEGFFARSGRAITDFYSSAVEHPINSTIGSLKGLAGGAVQMGELAAKGLAGLSAAITAPMTVGQQVAENPDKPIDILGATSKAFQENFNVGSKAVDDWLAADRQASKGVLLINLAPANKQEEAFQNFLGIIPDGINTAGETVYDKTGSALAATGAISLLTLLSLKPSSAAKPFDSMLKLAKDEPLTAAGKTSAEKVQTAFDELAVKDPQGATALAEHVITADPEVGLHLMKSIDDAGKWTAEEIGQKAAKDEMAAVVAKEAPENPAQAEAQAAKIEASPTEGLIKATREFVQALDLPTVQLGEVAREIYRKDANKAYAEQLVAQEREYTKSQITHEVDETGVHTVKSPNGVTEAQVSGNTLRIKQTETAPAAKGQGEGTLRVEKLYDEAQKAGLKLTSDVTVSKAQQRVYESLKKRGYTVKENHHVVNPETGGKISTDPRVPVYEVTKPKPKAWNPKGNNFVPQEITAYYDQSGKPVTRSSVERAFRTASQLSNIPGVRIVVGKLTEYYQQIIHTVNPEALGPEAKTAASILAKRIAEQMQKDSAQGHKAAERIKYWNHQDPQAVIRFIRGFEKGERFDDPLMQKAAEGYRQWNKEIFEKDQKLKIDYQPVDNYLYHTFEDSGKVSEFFAKRFGSKWNNPSFMKDRTFDLYAEGVKAGFKPKFTNPEDIMLARQHASNIAEMRINALDEMQRAGVAKTVDSGKPDFPATEWRAPNGERYWVHDSASAVLNNAFNTKSLWAMPGMVGDAFRTAMFLKNALVPIKLALSLFHPLHVLTIDNATGMVRATKELLSGTKSPVSFVADMGKSALYTDVISNPKIGYRLLNAYRGKGTPNATDLQSLQYMAEGGFIPEMSSQYKLGAIDKFKRAIQQRSATSAWHLPFAALEAMGYPMFQVWIPSLKIASYLKDVQTALRTDPTLSDNPIKRQLAFRRISKSVDNRYGEMAYSTLFWNRWVKDLAVANTLSLGWQMGFLREYGGGTMDLGQMAVKQGSFKEKVAKGMLDRPLFVTYYTTQALAYGGLLTWALSGNQPKDLKDYIYPQSGEQQANGRPERVNTMFYPREFASVYKHIENEGVVSGLGHLASSKASGIIGMTREWATGVNSFDQEIRDPNAPAYKQVEQTLASTLLDLEPISIETIHNSKAENKTKAALLAAAGFGPAPKYVTETKTEALIKGTFQKYFSQRLTPYDKAQGSSLRKELKKSYDNGDSDKYSEVMDKMQEKFQMTGLEQRNLTRSVARNDDPLVYMFSRLTWQQQKKILDQMTDDERETFLPKANKQHLRYSYEPPETK